MLRISFMLLALILPAHLWANIGPPLDLVRSETSSTLGQIVDRARKYQAEHGSLEGVKLEKLFNREELKGSTASAFSYGLQVRSNNPLVVVAVFRKHVDGQIDNRWLEFDSRTGSNTFHENSLPDGEIQWPWQPDAAEIEAIRIYLADRQSSYDRKLERDSIAFGISLVVVGLMVTTVVLILIRWVRVYKKEAKLAALSQFPPS